jgi:hypothetical protein
LNNVALGHQTLEIRRGHAGDEVTVEHLCGSAGQLVQSLPIALSGPDAAIVNLGGEFVVTVTCAVCGTSQVVHLRGSGSSDLGR